GAGWTDIIACDRDLLFYRSDTGKMAAGRLGTDGTYTNLHDQQLSAGWTDITACDRDLLFYRSDTGKMAAGRLGTDGTYTNLH
ncbi:hypothetical protein ABTX77_42115, partial [Streptomyces sp. NPDC097704]|uniref:hypothetical protein n=1 Tax=Streptomyces sp. NPDC097704 TaxID=3157101 RepID=UPI003331D9D9